MDSYLSKNTCQSSNRLQKAIQSCTDNQFKPNEVELSPKPCVIAPRTKESERYLRNQGEIH